MPVNESWVSKHITTKQRVSFLASFSLENHNDNNHHNINWFNINIVVNQLHNFLFFFLNCNYTTIIQHAMSYFFLILFFRIFPTLLLSPQPPQLQLPHSNPILSIKPPPQTLTLNPSPTRCIAKGEREGLGWGTWRFWSIFVTDKRKLFELQ